MSRRPDSHKVWGHSETAGLLFRNKRQVKPAGPGPFSVCFSRGFVVLSVVIMWFLSLRFLILSDCELQLRETERSSKPLSVLEFLD